MNENLHDTDFLFQKKLSGYSEEPPAELWQKIDNELNKKDAALYKSKYSRLKKMYTVMLFTAVLLLISYALPSSLPAIELTKHSAAFSRSFGVHATNANRQNIHTATHLQRRLYKKNNTIQLNQQAYRVFDPKPGIVKLNLPLACGVNESAALQKLLQQPAPRYLAVDAINKKNVNTSRRFGHAINMPRHSFYIRPYFSFDHITGRFRNQYVYDNETDSRAKEKPDMSYTFGLMAEREMNYRFSLQSGILISHSFTSISPTVVKALQNNSGIYSFKLATDYGFASIKRAGVLQPQQNDSLTIMNGAIHIQSISVPVLLKLKIKQGRFKVEASGGGALNTIISDKAEVEYSSTGNIEKETIEKIDNLRKNYFTLIAGAEASYAISKNIQAGINPVLRYAVTPVNRQTPVITYPVNIGAGIFVSIKF